MADQSTIMQIVIEAQNKTQGAFADVQGKLDGLKGRLESMGPAFSSMQKYGTIAFAAIAGEAVVAIKAFADSQKQMAVVDGIMKTLSTKTLKQLGGSVDSANQKMQDWATKMQKLGGISDEELAKGLARLTQRTGDFTKAQRDATIAADLAKFKQIDYASAIDIVGKVQSGNTAILARYGIQVDKNATSEQAIAAIAKMTAGQYEAYGKTLAGQTDIIRERIGDLQENIGKALLPILTKLLEKIQPIIEKVVEWTNAHPELVGKLLLVAGAVAGLVAIVGTLGLALPALITGLSALGTVLMFLAANPIGLTIVALGALVAIVLKIRHEYGSLTEFFKQTWDGVKIIFKEAIDWIMAKLQPLLNAVQKVKDTAKSLVPKMNEGASLNPFSSSFQLPHFANGGVVPGPNGKPTLAVVHGGERVLTADEARGGQGTVYNITFNGDITDKGEFVKQIKEQFSKIISLKQAMP